MAIDESPTPEFEGSFGYQLHQATEYYRGESENAIEHASAEIKAAAWAAFRMRLDITEQLRAFEIHLESASRRIEECLDNISNAESIEESDILSPSGLLSPTATAARLKISRSALVSLTRDDRFPKPIQVSPKRTAFIATEIEAWLRGAHS